MRLFTIAAGIVVTFALLADVAISQAADDRTHARWAAEARCLDTNTAALPQVQQMCAELAARAVPEP
jgi:hypothetical protein